MSKKKKYANQNKKSSVVNKANERNKSQEGTAAKKAEVLGTEKKGHLPLYMAIGFVAVIAGFSMFYFTGFGKKSSPVTVQTACGPRASTRHMTW